MDSLTTHSQNSSMQSLPQNDITNKLISKLKQHQAGHRENTLPTKALLNSLDIEELDISREHFFQLILPLICKISRSMLENQMIYGYLTLLTEFVQMIKKTMEEHYYELLLTVAFYLIYEKHEKNTLLFKIGDKGYKFYIILQGSVDVIILENRHVTITEQDYLTYLATLKKYEENEILDKCIQINRKNYREEDEMVNEISSPYSKPAGRKSSCKMAYAKLSKRCDDLIHRVTTEDYIQRLKVYTEVANVNDTFEYNSRRLVDVVVYEYRFLVTLTTGNRFGEIALSNPSESRTASIITQEECHFGILNKETYTKCIKEANDKTKRLCLNFICNSQLFSGVNRNIFEKKYLSYFVNMKLEHHKQILAEGCDNTSLFLIKEGEYDVYMKKSLHELTLMIKYFEAFSQKKTYTHKLDQSERKEQEMLEKDRSFKRYYHEKKLIRLTVIKGKDVVGLGDYIWRNNKNAFTVECTTNTGEVMELEKQYYNLMYKYEECISAKEKDFLEMKYEYMLERLMNIREMKISAYHKKYFIENSQELKGSNIHGKTKSIISVFNMEFQKLKTVYNSNVLKKKTIQTILTRSITLPNKKTEKIDSNTIHHLNETESCAIPEDNASQFTEKQNLHEQIIPTSTQTDKMYIPQNTTYSTLHTAPTNNFSLFDSTYHRKFSGVKFSCSNIRNKIFKKEIKGTYHAKMSRDIQRSYSSRKNAIEFLGRLSISKPQNPHSVLSLHIKHNHKEKSVARLETPLARRVKLFIERKDLVTNKANSLYSPQKLQTLKKQRYEKENEALMFDAHYISAVKQELFRKERERYTINKTRNCMLRFINKDNNVLKK